MTLIKTLAAAGLLLGLAACGSGGGGGAAASLPAYTVGGTVSGLVGTVVLQDDGGDNLSVSANGTFTFATKVASGGPYSVTVLTQPAGMTCSVSSGAGTISGNVSNVAVVCSKKTYSVGGSVSGLTGTVVLQDNNGDNLSIAANGVFTFATPVAVGSPYSVTVFTQPAKQACSVSTGTGTISASNVTNVAVSCVNLMGGAVIGTPLNLTTAVSTFAGSQSLDGTGTAARFNNPTSAASDGTNLYVADSVNNKIRKIVIATGAVTTLAGSGTTGALDGTGTAATFNGPTGITTDNTNLYVADRYNNKIRKIVIATGVVTTLAGSGTASAIDSTTGTAATFNNPYGITTDGTNLYVADIFNNKIRQIVIATGAVTTLAGSGVAGAADNTTGTSATFNWPDGIIFNGTNLYVSDMNSNKIRKIVISSGAVSTLAGSGAVGALDGTGTAATFSTPVGITTDGTNLYVADRSNNKIRQIVIASGAVTTLAGSGAVGAADATGTAATFNWPNGITTDGTNLYVADIYNNTIRQIVKSTGAVTTLAGTLPWVDGTGTAATFNTPISITTDGANLYVADMYNNKIRQIVISSGVVTTLAGSGAAGAADATGTAATFNWPVGITTDGTNLYVADQINNKIRKIVIATGAVTTLAGSGAASALDGTGTAATFNNPTCITTDGTNLYVTDMSNQKIRQIVIATGAVTTLAGSGAIGASDATTGTAATFNSPTGITTDGTNLYVADYLNHKIRKIVIASGVVTTLAGSGTASALDGTGTAATFANPYGITSDGTNLYVADMSNQKIRKIVISSGQVSSLTGVVNTAGAAGATDGTGTAAMFRYPHGVTTDGTKLFVVDSINNSIRKIQ